MCLIDYFFIARSSATDDSIINKNQLVPAMRSLLHLGFAGLVTSHGYVVKFEIDGTTYPAYNFAVEQKYGKPTRNIEWAFPEQPIQGAGPVLDVDSPDIACRKNPIAPQLTAKARAGSKIKFQWSTYFDDHKGPVITYIGLIKDPNVKPQEVSFFKIDEAAYDPSTKIWGSTTLIKANNSRTVTIPSDIKAGRYMIRHEILSLHFSGGRNYVLPNGTERVETGAQFYPQCINVDITGSGTATPPGVKFPGAYRAQDPGVRVNSYEGLGVSGYTPPGPPVYEGARNAPEGVQPVVADTGADPLRIKLLDEVISQFKDSVGKINQHLADKGLVQKGDMPKTAAHVNSSKLVKGFVA